MENGSKVEIKQIDAMKELAITAGEKIMEIYHDDSLFLHIEHKKDHSPLTLADKVSNKVIVTGLKRAFPDYAILSEEEKDDKKRLEADYCFIVDPLDGTKEFLKRNGQFTVNIALSYQHRVIMGVIYVPVTQELYYAEKEMGSFFQTADGNVKKLQVSNIEDLENVRLVMSSSHGCKEMDELIEKYKFQQFVKMGSSLKGCLVARGEAEIYYRYNPTMEWDTAAMQCIAEEAGAIFRQMDDSEMLYNRVNPLNEKGFYVINSEKNRIR